MRKVAQQNFGEKKNFFRDELEKGTYLLNHEKVFQNINLVLGERKKAKGWDCELDSLVLELLAGLAVHHPSHYGGYFREVLLDLSIPVEAKLKSLQIVRYYFLNPDCILVSARLYKEFLYSPDASLRDFSIRSFLQAVTEMRVGGQIASALSCDESREEIRRILQDLSRDNWLEASELLDLLELDP